MSQLFAVALTRARVAFLLLALALGIGAALTLQPSTAMANAEDDERAERLADDMPLLLDDADAIKKGRERFGERCGYCHGGGGKGAKGPCLICGHFKRGGKSSSIYTNIAAGVRGTQMGAFGTSLSGEEILNIVTFLRSEQLRRDKSGENTH